MRTTRTALVQLALCVVFAVAGRASEAVDLAEAAARVERHAAARMKELHVPGMSVAVVRGGEVVLARGYGAANLELRSPAHDTTTYVIYSVTKTFTAAATLMLVEEGKIGLEESIASYLPDLPKSWHHITIRHLLNHTSGLPEVRAQLPKLGDLRVDYPRERVLQLGFHEPFRFPTGEQWIYTETNFLLLGHIIEEVSGMPYGDFLRERIFKPLRMDDTRLDDVRLLIPHRADGYSWRDGRFINALRYSSTITFSTAGLVSTVRDLARWMLSLRNASLLRRSTIEQMWTSGRLNDGKETGYGFGFGLAPFGSHRRAGHVGGADGFAAAMTILRDADVGVIVLSNADQEGFVISDVANEIASFYLPRGSEARAGRGVE